MVGGIACFSQSAAAATGTAFRVTPPRGFENLDQARIIQLDVIYAGRKVGEAAVKIEGGLFTPLDPAALTAMLPGVGDRAALQLALTKPFRLAADVPCTAPDGACSANPPDVSLALNEDQFRLELFIPQRLLETASSQKITYLSKPDHAVSLISLVGGSISGAREQSPVARLQNRTIVAAGVYRLVADTGLQTNDGMTVDRLALETERQSWRLSAGLDWIPTLELAGRRQVLGIGAITQSDTWANRRAAVTPVQLFLPSPARVEILVDGRVLSSKLYQAGPQFVDTSSFPDGSYDVLIRIQEAGGQYREERRFFSTGARLAPLGRPIISAHLGFLQDGRGAFDTETPFASAGINIRAGSRLGVSSRAVFFKNKALLELGSDYVTPIAALRAATLLSSSGDLGFVVAASTTVRRISASFDLRSVRSRNGAPLLPVSRTGKTFIGDPAYGLSSDGSFTQAIGSLSWALASANIRVLTTFRRQASDDHYGVSGIIDVPLKRIGGDSLRLQTEVRKTSEDTALLATLRLFRAVGGWSFGGSAGLSWSDARKGKQPRLIGDLQASRVQQLGDNTEMNFDAALVRDTEATSGRFAGELSTSQLRLGGEVLHNLEDGQTQYTADVQTALVWGGRLSMAARKLQDGALHLSAVGAPDERFEVLVNGETRGHLSGNGHTTIMVAPFAEYHVRLRATSGSLTSYDSNDRLVTVYPGTVAKLSWNSAPSIVIYGQALSADGVAVRNARVASSVGVGQTDDTGVFQIEARLGDVLEFTGGSEEACLITTAAARPEGGLWIAGRLTCLSKGKTE